LTRRLECTRATQLTLGSATLVLAACVDDVVPTASGPLLRATSPAGLDFRHRTGGVGKRELPEAMGGGVALLDHDRDGDLDLYLVQSGAMRGEPVERKRGARNALYAGDGRGAFQKVAGAAGANDDGYGQGVAVGDVDGDGWDDLIALNWGPNRAYRNVEGRFVDATAAWSLDSGDDWSVSATFVDADGDGDLDLYVVNYLTCAPGSYVALGEPDGFSSYPHPDRYPGQQDRLFANEGGARMRDVTAGSGVEQPTGKGLGVVATDCDLDGFADLYVANDSTPNFLFRNLSGLSPDGLRFAEVGHELGVAYNEDGRSEAGMGVDTGDIDEDGDLDLFVTNLDQETNTLYLNETARGADGLSGRFRDAARRSGMATASRPLVGFGTLLNDVDGDGHLDVFVANGHIIDNIGDYTDMESYPQPNHLFLGDGTGRFAAVAGELAGTDLETLAVSRGVASGDLDGDGDLDYVVGTIGGEPQVFLGSPRWVCWLSLALAGPGGNPHGLGASLRVELEDGRTFLRRIEAGRSYASSSAPRLVLGLSSGVRAVLVLWPGGFAERFETSPAGFRGEQSLRYGDGTPTRFDGAP
jgi:hypothetical protein